MILSHQNVSRLALLPVKWLVFVNVSVCLKKIFSGYWILCFINVHFIKFINYIFNISLVFFLMCLVNLLLSEVGWHFPLFLHILLLSLVFLLIDIQRCKGIFNCGFNLYFLTVNDIDHLLTYLLDICMSLRKCVFGSFAYFFHWAIRFYYWIKWVSCIVWIYGLQIFTFIPEVAFSFCW